MGLKGLSNLKNIFKKYYYQVHDYLISHPQLTELGRHHDGLDRVHGRERQRPRGVRHLQAQLRRLHVRRGHGDDDDDNDDHDYDYNYDHDHNHDHDNCR